MADLSKTVTVNVKAADGIKKVAQRFGVAEQGTQSAAMPFAEAVQAMLQPKYDGCVFAVLVVSAGPQIGNTPQMGVKATAAARDLGNQQNVSFLAFSR